MKIAVILNSGSVGGWRWAYSVFSILKKFYEDNEITIFYKKNNALPSDILKKIQQCNITIVEIPELEFIRRKFFRIKIIDNIINHIRKNKGKKNYKKLKQSINENFDIAYNVWPYGCEPIKLDIPSFFIPHDFIFTHFFGFHVGNIYNYNWFKSTRDSLKKFLDYGYVPCVTSNFIKSEFYNTFPEYNGKIHKVMTLLNNDTTRLPAAKCLKILNKFNIKNEYILYPTNNMHHKNMEEAMTAYYYVKQKYPNLKMIIIGCGTEGVCVKMNSPYYADHIDNDKDYDIKSLGLVSDEELQALMIKSKLVLNTSLCEAACGSGVDAWSLGVPTAISDIPCYREQVEIYGVKTEFFDPKNSKDIASAILRILDNPKQALDNAQKSKEALNSVYTQKDMADNYMSVFKKYVR